MIGSGKPLLALADETDLSLLDTIAYPTKSFGALRVLHLRVGIEDLTAAGITDAVGTARLRNVRVERSRYAAVILRVGPSKAIVSVSV